MLKIILLLIWKRKNLITLSILPNIILNIFVGVLDKYLKVLVDRNYKNFLPVIATPKRCVFAIDM